MINRIIHQKQIETALRRSPITGILGPRQCGKTTLARMFGKDRKATYYDLESETDVRRLQNPELTLGSAKGIVILDEIQRKPELFKVLRVMVDKPDCKVQFIILGSASPELVKNVSESLAGRIEFIDLSGFNTTEIPQNKWKTLWVRGGFPRSYLANTQEDSESWREQFVRTFLERDIPQIGITIPPAAIRRFWTMLAHYHGQLWNASEFGRSMSLNHKTVRGYLDILSGTFMVRQLQPWHENIAKRQVKSPKIYLTDSGLLHTLLNIGDEQNLLSHPKVGASWEGFALEQFIQIVKPSTYFFWSTYSGAELDLFFIQEGKRYGVEFKFNEAPNITKSMKIAIEDLSLEHLWIVYPGSHDYPAEENISVLPLKKIPVFAKNYK